MVADRKSAKKEIKKNELIEQQRLRIEDLQEQEALDNAKLLHSDSDSQNSDEADLSDE